ncbi:MAG TPA: methyl-accepting chemotaxis protein [Rhodanobacter sp.]|nr:methyl-accepting chemotaxis protein [Rhodanobacter sp.]
MSRRILAPLTLNVSTQLVLRLIGSVLLLIIVCGATVRQLTRADHRIRLVVVDTLAPVADVGHIQNDYNDIMQVLVHAALMQLPSSVNDASAIIKSDRVDIDRHWASLVRSGLAQQQRQLFVLAAGHRKDAEQAVEEALTILEAGRFDIAQLKLANDVQSSFVPLKSDFSNLFSLALAQGQAQAAVQHVSNRHDLFALLILLCLAMGLAVWVDITIIRSLGKRMKCASEVATRIAGGVLGEPIDIGRGDEVGLLLGTLSQMDVQLESVVGEVRERAWMVEQSATAIAHGNEALSKRTQTQATHLESTATSMARMSAAITQSVRHADQASQAANDVQGQTEQGRDAVAQAVTSMNEINRTGRRMGEVLDLVDQVAFQTHMLALNAAVEAAQAGVHGRGFGVIAAEVRQLAHRCGQAARDIRQMISESDEAVRTGSVLVNRTGTVLEDVAIGVNRLSELVAVMASTGRGHATDIGLVNDAVVEMDAMTRQNATLVEEAAVASRAMRESAVALLREVDFFTLQNDRVDRHAAAVDSLGSAITSHSQHPLDRLLELPA